MRAAGQEAEEAAQHSVNGSSGGGEPTVTAADLRALQVQLERQQQAQAQALQLIQDQQRTIATLEARLERARAPTPLPPSKTAGSDSDSDTPRHPLDGPEAVLEPTALERPLAGSGRYKVRGGPEQRRQGKCRLQAAPPVRIEPTAQALPAHECPLLPPSLCIAGHGRPVGRGQARPQPAAQAHHSGQARAEQGQRRPLPGS